MPKFFIIILSIALTCLSLSANAYTNAELETFDNEPPLIKDLLMQANLLVGDDADIDNTWRAAKLYCEAARYGSAEGIYRLGMLYAFGRGVPENRDYAANLFGIASMHGHMESQKMLADMQMKATNTPPCVLAAVAPEKAPTPIPVIQPPEIDRYIANLPKDKRWVLKLVDSIAKWYKIDPKLVLSIISVESNFENVATSNKDAQGLMQLIPDTAERFNVKNAYNATQNIKGGVAYLRWLLAYFKGDVALAVAAYNAGEGAVNKYNGVPPYPETRQYVKDVTARYPFKTHSFDAKITEPSPMFNSVKFKRRG